MDENAASHTHLLHSNTWTAPQDSKNAATGPESSPDIKIDEPMDHVGRPRHMSEPAFASPLRHHQRAPSRSNEVKETRNARSHYGSGDDSDGVSVHRINQYIIKQEIGRGSFGSVHLAVDQYGNEYAVKEFSKSRLRKRAQSNLLRKPNRPRRPPPQLSAGVGFNSPLHRHNKGVSAELGDNAFSLIKEEIAIMKKLSHNNLVSLIEVLDDPDEDSLYMVLEICKKGVVMKVGLDERAEPYNSEACRCWFRDMILGIEYLHAQGIIHRDIKPDNCLITNDDVLKIVDFGVSEMFEKDNARGGLATAKSAGSPAFMPPELCVPKHGAVSGKAADIWSMGVTLYCLRYGHIPFEKTNMLELYESIRRDGIPVEDESDANFKDLILRILEKDPDKRITMEEIRNHPWVTKDGSDPLLPKQDNCADIVDPPTEAEMDAAITGNMENLIMVMKAVKSFKRLASEKRQRLTEGFLGRGRRTQPPMSMAPSLLRREHSTGELKEQDQLPESALVADGLHRQVDIDDKLAKLSMDQDDLVMDSTLTTQATAGAKSSLESERAQNTGVNAQREETARHPVPIHGEVQDRQRNFTADDRAKGHAHDPLEDTLFLDIGAAPDVPEGHGDPEHPVVSESPSAVEMNIYEQAYQDEMDRILQDQGQSVNLLLNRRVEHRDDLRKHPNIFDSGRQMAQDVGTILSSKLGDLNKQRKTQGGAGFANLALEQFVNRASPVVEAARQKLEERQRSFQAQKEASLGGSRSGTPAQPH